MVKHLTSPLIRGGILLATLCVSGCVSTRVEPLGDTGLLAQIEARGLDPREIILPYELTDEMRTWVWETVPRLGSDHERLDILLGGLFSGKKVNLQYERLKTRTAAEAFRDGQANCLSFTHLYVGLAREIGLNVGYLEVEDYEGFERDGDLVLVSGHVTASYGPPLRRKILEFGLPNQEIDYRHVRDLEDITAISFYYGNRGAELLRQGDVAGAKEWLDKAVKLDPERASNWVNQGVVLRRRGRFDAAEGAYRQALEIDPELAIAYRNLAALLEVRGRVEEAIELLSVAEKLGTNNPYTYLDLGDVSLAFGRIDEARGYYRRALRLHNKDAEPHAAMGFAELADGNRRAARRWLSKARRIDSEGERVRLLEARLGDSPDRASGAADQREDLGGR